MISTKPPYVRTYIPIKHEIMKNMKIISTWINYVSRISCLWENISETADSSISIFRS